jgi:putative membrane protein
MRLSTEDRARIHAALVAAQARTHAQFTLMIVPLSDRYAMYPVAWAGMFALAVGALLALFWQHVGLRLGFLFEAAAFGFAALLLDIRPLHLALVPKRMKQARARAMAHREFAASILAAQNPAGGIVLFVSLGERYVEIIADRTVHARVGEAAWNQIVSDFASRAKSGAVADGFIHAIEACAGHLETHFPQAGPTEAHA